MSNLIEKILTNGRLVKEKMLKAKDLKTFCKLGILNSANLALYLLLSNSGNSINVENKLIYEFFPRRYSQSFVKLASSLITAYLAYEISIIESIESKNELLEHKKLRLNIIEEFFVSELKKFDNDNLKCISTYVEHQYFS